MGALSFLLVQGPRLPSSEWGQGNNCPFHVDRIIVIGEEGDSSCMEVAICIALINFYLVTQIIKRHYGVNNTFLYRLVCAWTANGVELCRALMAPSNPPLQLLMNSTTAEKPGEARMQVISVVGLVTTASVCQPCQSASWNEWTQLDPWQGQSWATFSYATAPGLLLYTNLLFYFLLWVSLHMSRKNAI